MGQEFLPSRSPRQRLLHFLPVIIINTLGELVGIVMYFTTAVHYRIFINCYENLVCIYIYIYIYIPTQILIVLETKF
jgi:hypothetical protein